MQAAAKWPKPAPLSKISAETFWRARCLKAIIRHWAGTVATRTGHPAAPITNMRILDIPQSGKCSDFVSVRTRYGQIRRRRGVIRKRPSPDQLRIRAIFALVVALWRNLTEQQRAAWTVAGQAVQSRPRLGQSGKLPGDVLFIKLNTTLGYQGLPFALTPPARPSFPANSVGDLVITNTGGAADIKLSVPSAPAMDILVFATAPRSAGVAYPGHFTILGQLPAPEAGYSNIRKLYVDRYGEPPPGTRIFIRTRQQRDGWVDSPKQTAAIVPNP